MLVEAQIQRLAIGVFEVREEMKKLQLELNLQITELRLKVQLYTALEVREQRASCWAVDAPIACFGA